MPEVRRIPRWPAVLELFIERYWDGTPCDDARLHGRVEIGATDAGLRLVARLPHQARPIVPDAAPGTRVERLWETDVVECFLVGAGGHYTEVELGGAGHFLVLRFDAVRRVSDACQSLAPRLEFSTDTTGWRSSIDLPAHLVPEGLCAVNAFVAVGASYLAHHPVPGAVADFHQPVSYPPVRLDA